MNKNMMILAICALLSLQLHAEDTRDQVRNEILKSFDEANQARQTTINELEKTVKSIEDARSERGDINETKKSMETKIVESEALGNIAKSTAAVEIAKIHAKETMIKAIIKVESVKPKKETPQKIENEKALAAKEIAKAISSVEIVKAHAARSIINATKKVEISKTKEKYNLADDDSALKVAKNESAVQIAKSVSAVEIAQAVSEVGITKALLDENVKVKVKEQYKDLTLDEIKSKARAEISMIQATMEVRRAKSLSDIAKIVSFVKIAEAIKLQGKNDGSIETDDKKASYPKKFLRFHVK